jgi:dTDP-4-amino-4,6-dideoxygalactose transaminase
MNSETTMKADSVGDLSRPVRSAPMPNWPYFTEEEIDAVSAVLRSGKVNYWTGDAGRAFEREYAAHVGCKHAIALANGTVALELCLRVLGIGPGDEVIVTPRSFIASVSCVITLGAKPVFADVDAESQNITADTIRKVLSPKTKAIIPVHLAGWPCDMDPIMELAREHGLKVVEDCAQAHGAKYKGRAVGSLGHMAAFSFCQDKIITTGGEGGLITTDDDELWEKAWSYKEHGKSYDAVYKRRHPPGFKWLHESFGTNFRLTEMQSVIGSLMLKNLPKMVAVRQRNAAILTRAFSDIPELRVTVPPADIEHSYYRYYVFVNNNELRPGWHRDRIVQELITEGIPGHSGACGEIYLEKSFDGTGLRPPKSLEVAAKLRDESLMFIVHPALGQADIEDMCKAMDKIMAKAAK